MAQNKTATTAKKVAKKTVSKTKVVAYHHGDLKATLVNTAVKMLETLTPENLSLRELARAAGVSQAAPYRHFKNKEELLAAINQQGFELKFKFMKEAVDKHLGDPLEMYFQCGLAYFRMGQQHPQHFKLMTTSENTCPKPDYPELLKAATVTFALLRDVVIIAQKAKIIGDGNPYIISLNCWCMVHGFTSLYVQKRFDWLGIDEQNAEAGLRSLLGQFLRGGCTKLDSFGFSPFKINDTAETLKLLESVSILEK